MRPMVNKILAAALAVVLVLALCGCGAGRQPEPPQPAEEAAAPEETPDSPADAGEAPAETGTDVLVVVFSATGNTKGVAEKIAALTGADLRQIVPAQPYTTADLQYSDKESRTTKEQNDPDARPEIAEDISLDGYAVVYLGYPIWWAQAPRILSTFVESHDFAGITVIPFCTSGSSDIGESDDTLAAQAGSGNWLEGRRFPGDVTEDELSAWIDEVFEAAVCFLMNIEKRIMNDGIMRERIPCLSRSSPESPVFLLPPPDRGGSHAPCSALPCRNWPRWRRARFRRCGARWSATGSRPR